MKELYSKIVEYWNNNIRDCKLYFGEAPQNATLPYAVMTVVMQTSPDTFSEDVEVYSIRFNIFDDEKSALRGLEIYENVRKKFDYHLLNLPTFNHIFTRPAATQIFRGDGVWQFSLLYDFYIER